MTLPHPLPFRIGSEFPWIEEFTAGSPQPIRSGEVALGREPAREPVPAPAPPSDLPSQAGAAPVSSLHLYRGH